MSCLCISKQKKKKKNKLTEKIATNWENGSPSVNISKQNQMKEKSIGICNEASILSTATHICKTIVIINLHDKCGQITKVEEKNESVRPFFVSIRKKCKKMKKKL